MNHSSKPRIALFAMGIIGGGSLDQGIPVLADLFARLSRNFEIVYYCFQPVNKTNVPIEIKVRSATILPFPGRIKYILLLLRFCIDQLIVPYQLFFAISIYPPGRAAVFLGKIFRKPVITQIIALEAVSLPEIGAGNLDKPGLSKITRSVCAETDVLLAVAEYQKTMAQRDLPTSRNIDVLPLRIDSTKYTFNKRKIAYPVQFISIGYYSPIKNQDMMFNAFALVNKEIDCRLTVIGDGFNTSEVQSLLHRLGIKDKVTFTGVMEHRKIPVFLNKAHILLHTARFETGCAVIQEAMASGVAVCGTNVGILTELDESHAVIVESGDARNLAAEILKLVNDQGRFTLVTETANNWIRQFDAVWSAENYAKFLKGVLKKTH